MSRRVVVDRKCPTRRGSSLPMRIWITLLAAGWLHAARGMSGSSQLVSPADRSAVGMDGIFKSPTPAPPKSQLRAPGSGLPRPGHLGRMLSKSPALPTPKHRGMMTPTEMLLASGAARCSKSRLHAAAEATDHAMIDGVAGGGHEGGGEEGRQYRTPLSESDFSSSRGTRSSGGSPGSGKHGRSGGSGRRGRRSKVADEARQLEMFELRSTLQEQAKDLAQFRGVMEGALKAKEDEVLQLRKRLDVSQAKLREAEGVAKAAADDVSRLRERLKQQVEAMGDMGESMKGADEASRREMASLHVELAAARAGLAAAESGRGEAESLLRAARQEMVSLGLHMKSVRERNDALGKELKCKEEAEACLMQKIAGLEREVDLLRGRLGSREGQEEAERAAEDERMRAENKRLLAERKLVDDERRRLHSEIQELRGNIRVVLRVRPLLGGDDLASDQTVRFLGPTAPSGFGIELAKAGGAPGHHRFVFDSLLEPEASQEQVFEEVSQLVTSILDGYRVCMFAYGQTGSGKTYTMEGPPGCGDGSADRGLIPRAVSKLFEEVVERETRGWKTSVQVSFLEIYNEGLRDLLDNRPGLEKKMEIMTDPATGMTYVTNLITMEVLDCKVVESLLRRASKARATAATECNERSSRSHSIFTMKVAAVNDGTGQEYSGILNLVDLAGSERLSSSGAEGARLKETQSINKSLSSLGDVISALANKESHVPYRNSRLTHFLQPCLGGNSKTLMLVNVSPAAQHLQETLCSLRFAAKVSSCDVGSAQRSTRVKF